MMSPFQRSSPGLVLRIVTTGSLALFIAAGWCDREPAYARTTQSSSVFQHAAAVADSPPPMLLEVGEAAENLFDAARLSRWTEADDALETMKKSADNLPVTFATPDLTSRLQSRIRELEDTVPTRQRLQTMDFANGITRLVADLSAEYQTPLPYALVLLDYYGRELDIGLAATDQARLNRAAADLQQTWNGFERTILQRGAVEEARRFTDIVAQLAGAQAPGDFIEPTRAERAAVDRLEKMFRP
jgi:hypothetical protein